MALVLSLKQGDDIYVGDSQFVVSRIDDGSSMELTETASKKKHQIRDTEMCEIATDVFVSTSGLFRLGAIRVVFEAPREIVILNGDRFRQRSASPRRKVA